MYRDLLVFVDEVDCLLVAEVLDPEFFYCIAFEIVDVSDANVNQPIKAEELQSHAGSPMRFLKAGAD